MEYDFHYLSLASLTAVSDLIHFLIEFFIPDVKNIKRVYIFLKTYQAPGSRKM